MGGSAVSSARCDRCSHTWTVLAAIPMDSDVAAQEVARRSSWFHTPPAVVPKDVPIIEVQHSISQRVISRCPSRPRTAQPAMVVMAQAVRPHTANVQVSVGSERGERSPNCADGLKDWDLGSEADQ
eukprot:symbB.v1.2.009551.t1/scaffold604.1/size182248/9